MAATTRKRGKRRRRGGAYKVLILGDYGSGKTTALRNIPPEQLLILNFDDKRLPWAEGIRKYPERFRHDGTYHTHTCMFVPETEGRAGLKETEAFLKEVRAKNPQKKYFVLDTLYYLLQDLFHNCDEHDTFRKFDSLGEAAQDIVDNWSKIIGPDRFLIIHNHFTPVHEDGLIRHEFSVPKGKVIRDQVKPEGRMDMIVETEVLPNEEDPEGTPEYTFRVKSRGLSMDTIRTFQGLYPEDVSHRPSDTKALCDDLEKVLKGKVVEPPKPEKNKTKQSPNK